MFYDAGMDAAERCARELTAELKDAVGGDEFRLVYQVQACLRTGEVSGYEALARWTSPTRGAVSPGVFIPLAEEAGEIGRLGEWGLGRACCEAAGWDAPHPVAVNVSATQLSDPRLLDQVRQALARSGLAPRRLEIELTEGAIISDRSHAFDQLRALKALGVTIALDDFGSGYSSLDVLRSFPFDRIKLDASFVAEVERDAQAVAILDSVAGLGRSLGVPVLAEGVETAAQLRIVARCGCAHVQGFLLGRPSPGLMDAGEVRRTVRKAAGRPGRVGVAA